MFVVRVIGVRRLVGLCGPCYWCEAPCRSLCQIATPEDASFCQGRPRWTR